MVGRLEKILKEFGRGIIIAGLAASLFSGCQKESPVGPVSSQSPKNNPPVILSSPETTIEENKNYNYQVRASDADSDKLTYSLIKKPSWLSISDLGLISGTAPEVSSDQSNEIEVGVSDGKNPVSQKYDLTVKNLFNIYVLSPNQISSLIRDDSTSLSFSQAMNFLAGDIISSGISVQTPFGLLREVTSVSPDKKRFYTTQATLEQVVRDASLYYSGKLLPSASSSTFIEGVRAFPMSGQNFDFNINLTNVVLYDYDQNPNTRGDQLVANGNISFNTDMIFNLKINEHRIDELTFKNLTNINTDVTLGANTFGIARLTQIKIIEYKFQPFVAAYLPTPVPIPVIIVPKLGVYIEIDPTNINPLSVRVKQSANSDAGLIYNGIWSTTSNFSNSFEFSNPIINNDLELKVYVGPNLELLLYGVAGPFGGLRGRLRLKYQNRDWELYGGFGASLGVKMDVLKKGGSLQFKEIINYEKLLAKSTTSTLEGKIAFATIRDGDAEIYVMNPDGSNQVNLTNNTTIWDVEPSWSPDGTKILYSSLPNSTDDHDIWIMNPDGSNKTRLTTTSMYETSPVFSPAGDKIAYAAGYDIGYSQIYIMNANGSSPTKITNDNNHYYWDLSWFPGPRIAFYSNKDNSTGEIYTINSNGSNITRLTNNSVYDRFPSWSPDGSKIAFSTNKDGNEEVYIMNPNGSNPVNISNSPNTYDSEPSWSPDGKKIVYVSRQGTSSESNEIWTMDVNGSNKRRLTNNTYDDGSPAWSPK